MYISSPFLTDLKNYYIKQYVYLLLLRYIGIQYICQKQNKGGENNTILEKLQILNQPRTPRINLT